MVYLVGWAALYSSLALQMITRYRGRVFIFITIAYFAFIAFSRGTVGTDTGNYEKMLSLFVSGYEWDGREPGFVLFGLVLNQVLPSMELTVRFISLLIFGGLAAVAMRADQNERFLIMAYVLPAFMYQYSMNMVRIGLAAVIVLYGVQCMRLSGKRSAIRTGFFAPLFHYSAFFSLVYVYFSQRPWMRFYSTLGIIVAMFMMIAVFSLVETYFQAKIDGYIEFESPGPLSGMRFIIPLVFLLIAMLFGKLPVADKLKHVTMTVLFLGFGWTLAQFSYAGLRLIDLVAFVSPLAMLASYSRLQLEFDRPFKIGILLAGMLISAGVFRGFVGTASQGEYGFLPYETWF